MSKVKANGDSGVGETGGGKPSKEGYDFSKSGDVLKKVTEMRFNFGPKDSQSVAVDQTLAALFDTLSVECSSILVHPQWKHFRHIQMLKNDRTRLSNGIWRSWHMQFLKMKRPLYCSFDIDPALDHHKRQEFVKKNTKLVKDHPESGDDKIIAIVLEGKYWKRNCDAVAREYRKWRFYKEKTTKKLDPSLDKVRDKAAEMFRELTSSQQSQDMQVDPSGPPFPSYEGFSSEKMLTSDLYTEYGMMVQQPNLDMLNPMLDDILDRFSTEPMEFSLQMKQAPPSSMFVGDTMNLHSPITSYGQQQSQPLPQVPSSPFSTNPSKQQQQQQQHQELRPQTMPISPARGPSQNPVRSPGILGLDDPYPLGFINELQQQQPLAVTAQSDRVSLMALMQGEVLGEQRGIVGGRDETMLDLQMAGNIVMKCEDKFEDDLIISQRTLQQQQQQQQDSSSVFRTPQQHRYRQQGEVDIRHVASASGGSSNNSSSGGGDMGDGLFNVQQQQESSWFSTVMGSKDVIPSQPRPVGQYHQQQQQQHSYSSLPEPALSPVLSPTAGAGHSTPRMQLSSQVDMFQFASPVASPHPMMRSREEVVRQRRPSPPDFGRTPSADNLYGQQSRPPLERGSSEPVGNIHNKLFSLSTQCMKQNEELDKQKNIAETQYSEVLTQLIMSQGKSKPSEQQQKLLRSILSDPSLVGLLKNALLSNQQVVSSEQPQQPVGGVGQSLSSPATPAPVSVAPQKDVGQSSMSQLGGSLSSDEASASAAGGEMQSSFLSASQLSRMSEVNDFQKGLLMAAITQASSVQMSGSTSTPSTPGASGPSTPAVSKRLSLEEIASSPGMCSSEELSPTQAILKKFKNARHLSSSEKEMYKEIRRQSHISAEQKRRGSIKNGFDQLQNLVINPNAYPSGKVSKAAILEKTLEHIKQSHSERDQRETEIAALKARIEELNSAIVVCQEKMPISGAPVTRQRFEENRQRFRTYVQKRTLQNYKFWIFSIILQQLFESYNSMVSIGTVDELCRTVLAWFEQNCTLPALRPVVMNSLKELSQQTSILSDPSQVPRQLTQYAQQSSQEQDFRTSQDPRTAGSQDNLDLFSTDRNLL